MYIGVIFMSIVCITLTALVKGEITNTNSTRQQLSNANSTIVLVKSLMDMQCHYILHKNIKQC